MFFMGSNISFPIYHKLEPQNICMIISMYHKNLFCFRHIILNNLHRTTAHLAEGIMVDI